MRVQLWQGPSCSVTLLQRGAFYHFKLCRGEASRALYVWCPVRGVSFALVYSVTTPCNDGGLPKELRSLPATKILVHLILQYVG